MISILAIILPVFLVLGAGYAAVRTGYLARAYPGRRRAGSNATRDERLYICLYVQSGYGAGRLRHSDCHHAVGRHNRDMAGRTERPFAGRYAGELSPG